MLSSKTKIVANVIKIDEIVKKCLVTGLSVWLRQSTGFFEFNFEFSDRIFQTLYIHFVQPQHSRIIRSLPQKL